MTGKHRKPSRLGSRRGQSLPVVRWLQAGAVAAGMGAALTVGHGVALADDTTSSSGAASDSASSSSSSSSGSSGESGSSSASSDSASGSDSDSDTPPAADPDPTSDAASDDDPADTDVDPSPPTTAPDDDSAVSGSETADETSPSDTDDPAVDKNDSAQDASTNAAATTSSADVGHEPTSATVTTAGADTGSMSATVSNGTEPSSDTYAMEAPSTAAPAAVASRSSGTAAVSAAEAPYPDAVTAPVTWRSIVADILRWTGFGALSPDSPIPPTQVPDLLAAAWMTVRRMHYSFFNSMPTLAPSQTGQDPDTGTITGTLGARDADGDVLTYTVINGPAHGTIAIDQDGTYTYTPDSGFAHAGGADTFTVTVSDTAQNPWHTHGLADLFGPATTTITVTVAQVNHAPVAPADIADTDPDTDGHATGTLAATDPDADPLTYTLSTDPHYGAATVDATGHWTYTANAAARHAVHTSPATAATEDSFTVTISDGLGGQTTTTITVTLTPANGAPTATADIADTDPDTDGHATGTLAGTDPDGDALTYALGAGPSLGTATIDGATGAWTYTAGNQARHARYTHPDTAPTQDTFTITTSDAYGGQTTTTITVTLTPLNHAPTAPLELGTTVINGATVTGPANMWDPDGDPLTYTITTGPTHGSVTIDGTGRWTYRPTNEAGHARLTNPDDPNVATQDSFTITTSDPYGGHTATTISVPINPINQPPTVDIDVERTIQEGSFNGVPFPVDLGDLRGWMTLTSGISDPDGDTGTVTMALAEGDVNLGSLTLNSDGTYTFVPTLNARFAAWGTDLVLGTLFIPDWSGPIGIDGFPLTGTTVPWYYSDGPDTVTVLVTAEDAYGGTSTTEVAVPIIPQVPGVYGPGNTHRGSGSHRTTTQTPDGAVYVTEWGDGHDISRSTLRNPNGEPLVVFGEIVSVTRNDDDTYTVEYFDPSEPTGLAIVFGTPVYFPHFP